MELTENNEICGVLDSIESSEGKLILKFSVVKVVEMSFTSALRKELLDLRKQKICIINIDGEYHVRKISK